MSRKNTIGSILARIEVLANGCWLSEWKPDKRGYVSLNYQGRMQYLHIIVCDYLIGPCPDGLERDHLCRNHWCSNPVHIEAVTHLVNVLRGNAPSAINARKTECKRGHSLTGSNLYIQPSNGHRTCRICARVSKQRYKRKVVRR